MKERIETLSWFVVAITVIIVMFVVYSGFDPYQKVKSGEYILECNGKEISPEKIVGFIEERNIWCFTNGYAQNCTVLKKEKE